MTVSQRVTAHRMKKKEKARDDYNPPLIDVAKLDIDANPDLKLSDLLEVEKYKGMFNEKE